ncbi:hypothetical protein BBJ28_00013181, partial [Nothophytophthora sp. Chile5]
MAATDALAWWEAPYYTEAGWRASASAVPYFQGALLFLTAVYVFETYLDLRQHQKLKDTTFPAPLADAIGGLDSASAKPPPSDTAEKTEEPTLLVATLAKFDKSRAYGLDKSTFGFISGLYSQLEATALLLLGYLPFMWTVSGRALVALGLDAQNEIYLALMLLTLTTIRDTLVGLPFALYSTFVVEARHGFNKQTLGLFFMDKVKSFLLFVAIGFPVTAALIFVIRWGGEFFYMYVWAFLFVFS